MISSDINLIHENYINKIFAPISSVKYPLCDGQSPSLVLFQTNSVLVIELNNLN